MNLEMEVTTMKKTTRLPDVRVVGYVNNKAVPVMDGWARRTKIGSQVIVLKVKVGFSLTEGSWLNLFVRDSKNYGIIMVRAGTFRGF